MSPFYYLQQLRTSQVFTLVQAVFLRFTPAEASAALLRFAGATVAIDGGSGLATCTWPLADHDAFPVFGTPAPKSKL